MNLSDEVDLETMCPAGQDQHAEISAICQEAGMHAVRKNRYVIQPRTLRRGTRPSEEERHRL